MNKRQFEGTGKILLLCILGFIVVILLLLFFFRIIDKDDSLAADNDVSENESTENHSNEEDISKAQTADGSQAEVTDDAPTKDKKNGSSEFIDASDNQKEDSEPSASGTQGEPATLIEQLEQSQVQTPFADNQLDLWNKAVQRVKKLIKSPDSAHFPKPGSAETSIVAYNDYFLVKGYFLATDHSGNLTRSYFECTIVKDEKGQIIVLRPKIFPNKHR